MNKKIAHFLYSEDCEKGVFPNFLIRFSESYPQVDSRKTAQILDTSEKFSFVKFFQCVAFLSNRVFSNFDYL